MWAQKLGSASVGRVFGVTPLNIEAANANLRACLQMVIPESCGICTGCYTRADFPPFGDVKQQAIEVFPVGRASQ